MKKFLDTVASVSINGEKMLNIKNANNACRSPIDIPDNLLSISQLKKKRQRVYTKARKQELDKLIKQRQRNGS